VAASGPGRAKTLILGHFPPPSFATAGGRCSPEDRPLRARRALIESPIKTASGLLLAMPPDPVICDAAMSVRKVSLPNACCPYVRGHACANLIHCEPLKQVNFDRGF
jgi:hypothetical protein